MKKKWIALLISAFATINAAATTLTVFNDANLNIGQWWNVRVYGKPLSQPLVGSLSGNWDMLRLTAMLSDDQLGQYRVSEVKFCIDRPDLCTEESSYKSCPVQDMTDKPVNEINAHIKVHLEPDNQCYATVTAQ